MGHKFREFEEFAESCYGAKAGYGATPHICPICGMTHGGPHGSWHEGGLEAVRPGKLAKIAAKKLLIEKLKSKMEARWGDKLDEIAEEIIDIAEAKKKMKAEHWQRKSKIKERFKEILAEGLVGEEEEE